MSLWYPSCCFIKKKHLKELETDDGHEDTDEGDDEVDEDSDNDQGEEWQEELGNDYVIEQAENLREIIVKIRNIGKIFKRKMIY